MLFRYVNISVGCQCNVYGELNLRYSVESGLKCTNYCAVFFGGFPVFLFCNQTVHRNKNNEQY